MARNYKAKICKSCGEEFVPRSGVQKICDDCRAALAEKPKRAPTNRQLAEMNGRQRATIKRLQEEIAKLKGTMLAPQQALVSQIEQLEKAIARQREIVGKGQRAVAVMGQRNHELRKAIAAAIESLQRILEEDAR